MTDLNQYLSLDACGIAAGLQSGEFAPSEILASSIAQQEKVEESINAITVNLTDRAMDQAKELDGQSLNGFQGLPFLLKDLTSLENTAITCGSRLFSDTLSDSNSGITQAFVDAGCLIAGKTNTPELGLTITSESVATGPCHNPWHLGYSTGGSSGGAAAAVAAGIVPVAHATDAGGSIRIPASCCGLYGFKPSRGLTVSDYGAIANQSGLTVNHVLTRTVRDSAHFLDLIRLPQAQMFPLPSIEGSFSEAYAQSPGQLKIGLQLEHPFGESIDEDVKHAVQHMANQCEALGHDIGEITHTADYGNAAKAMNKILCAHAFQLVKPRLAALELDFDSAEMETSTRQMAMAGSRITAADYVQALELLNQVAQQSHQLHKSCDVVLSPVLAKNTAELGWLNMNESDLKAYGDRFRAYSGFAALYNGTGQPSVSIPSTINSSGLPVGAMFSGPWGSDLTLLQLSRQLEQQNPWPLLAPLAAA